MPVRDETKKTRKTERFEYSYDEVVDKLKEKIEEKFGSMSKFLDSKAYEATGLGQSRKDRAKIYTYLANPTEKTKRVKSFPVIQKLFNAIEETPLEEERKTVVIHKVFSLHEL